MWSFLQDIPAEGKLWGTQSCVKPAMLRCDHPEAHGDFPARPEHRALRRILGLLGHSVPPARPLQRPGSLAALLQQQGLQLTLHQPRLGSGIVTATFQPQQGSHRGRWLDTNWPGGAQAWMVGDCLTTRWSGSISPEHPLRPCGKKHFNSIYGNNIYFTRWVSTCFKKEKEKISCLSSRHVTAETALFCQEWICHNPGFESTFSWHLTRQLYFGVRMMIIPWVHCCTNPSVVEIRNLPLHSAFFFI